MTLKRVFISASTIRINWSKMMREKQIPKQFTSLLSAHGVIQNNIRSFNKNSISSVWNFPKKIRNYESSENFYFHSA